MGTWSYSKEDRVRVEFDDIPEHLIQALVATEDVRYYDHSGIDGKSLLRVIVKSVILQQENSGGGSTITQQLAKQFYSEQAARKGNRRVLPGEIQGGTVASRGKRTAEEKD